MIAVSSDEEQPNGDVVARLFEWKVRDVRAPDIGNNNNDSTTSN